MSPVYETYPAVDENNGFPPVILDRLKTDLSSTFSPKTSMSVNLSDYNVVMDGTTNNTTKINQAIDAVGDGGELHFPPGNLAIYSGMVNSGKTIRFVGHGTTLTVKAAVPVFDLTGSWGTVYSVSSVTPVVVTHNSEDRNMIQLSVTGTLPYKRGDIVKVYADDILPGGRPGSGGLESRVGQFASVYSVAPGSVTLLVNELLDPMTTNIRVAKLNEIGGSIEGFRITRSTSLMTDGTKPITIRFQDLYKPNASDLIIENSPSQAITFTAYGYTANNIEIRNSNDDVTFSQYGYGILDSSGSFGTITNLRAYFVRHAYSDDSGRIAVNSAPTYYGRTYSTTVALSKAYGNSNSAWDTHHCSQNTSFIDCEALGTGGPGFALRGRKHTIRGGKVDSGRDTGIYVFSESGTDGDSWGHTITNVDIDSPVEPILIAVNKVSNIRETRRTYLNDIRIKKPNDKALRFVNATVDIGRVTINDVQMSGSSASNIKLDNSKAIIGSLSVDYKSGLPSTNPKGIELINSSDIKIMLMDVDINGTTNGTRFAAYIVSDINSLFRINRCLFNNGNPNTVTDFTLTSSGSYIDYIPFGSGATVSSSYITWSSGTTSAPQHHLSRSIAPHIIYAGLISTAYTLSTLRGAKYVGQRVTILNTGPVNLTIDVAGNFRTKTGAAITVGPGESADFVWVNSLYNQY